jgi:hypothetical protein
MSHKVDLGRKLKDVMNHVRVISGDDTDYPHLNIDNHDDTRLLDMPDQGEAKIRYRVKRREATEHTDENGKKKKKCSMCLEVHHIEHEEKEPKRRNHQDEARQSAKDYFDNLK